MPSSRPRRARGTKTVGLYVDVTPDVKERVEQYAAASRMPVWAVVEAAIKAGRPGPDGFPADWPLPVEADDKQNYDHDLVEAAAHAHPNRSRPRGGSATAA